jgi:hypothetical protein
VGGLLGGSGGLPDFELPKEVSDRLHRVNKGDIVIAVHSEDPAALRKAVRIFRSEDGEDIYDASTIRAA